MDSAIEGAALDHGAPAIGIAPIGQEGVGSCCDTERTAPLKKDLPDPGPNEPIKTGLEEEGPACPTVKDLPEPGPNEPIKTGLPEQGPELAS